MANTTEGVGMEHAFAGNPIIFGKRDNFSTQQLKELIAAAPVPPFQLKILPLFDGKPLVAAAAAAAASPSSWFLAWQSLPQILQALMSLNPPTATSDNKTLASDTQTLVSDLETLPSDTKTLVSGNETLCGAEFVAEGEVFERLVYIGEGDSFAYFALDVSNSVSGGSDVREKAKEAAAKFGNGYLGLTFMDLRTVMVATDWVDKVAMGELSIAGHARAMVEWHSLAKFCGRCGAMTVSITAGQRRQCSNSLCKHKWYPRIDPVVIMLVINKENDSALLGRQSRFVPRMWSCLAGFIEPGESLEEAVRRETREETGIEVAEIVYHSSQPWPVGPHSMSCQLMVGFFAFAKTLDIRVDKKELEDAQWHTREQVYRALQQADYKREQELAAMRVHKSIVGGDKERGALATATLDSTEIVPMFVPGPYAIAHHLISAWANNGAERLLSKF